MIHKTEAQHLIEQYIASHYEQCALMPECTQAFSFGWAFFYQSKKYIHTREFTDQLVGQGPLLFNQDTSEIVPTGSAHPPEYYAEAYATHGDPHADLHRTQTAIEILGCKRTPPKLAAVRYLKQIADISSAQAHSHVKSALEKDPVQISIKEPENIDLVVQQLTNYGFEVRSVANSET
ncbi:MAG: YrhB domain-containing protein [Cyanobacteria bacterium J06598_3]